jgi:hypothetical protein
MLGLAVYIAICIVVGLCGIDRRIGFFGTFFAAFLFSPLLVLPILLITAPLRRVAWRSRD